MKFKSAILVTLIVAASSLSLVTPSAAGEEVDTTAAMTKEDGAVDCTKEVWPNFSPSCLKNAKSTDVRLVTARRP